MEPLPVAILADDLIWSTRLADLVRRAGRPATVVRSIPGLARALAAVSEVIVDLTSRAYDGVAAVEIASHGGHRVLCVAQHDDVALRRRAIGAGAERVYAYRLLAERGPETVQAWLASEAGTTGTAAGDAGPAARPGPAGKAGRTRGNAAHPPEGDT